MDNKTNANNGHFARGAAMALVGASLWGISGAFSQNLFQRNGFDPEWVTTVRMLGAGIILLIYSMSRGSNITLPWKNKRDALSVFLFGILGMLSVQYTYFAAIKYSNAATATVLQYLGPVLIMIYFTIKTKSVPKKYELVAILCALSGTLLTVTHGRLNGLAISPQAAFWGIASAFALAFYSIQPKKLLEEYGSFTIIGWGMLIGGLCFCFVRTPWAISGVINPYTIFSVFFIVICGTLIAFTSYIASIKYVGPTKASLFACAEPLAAAFCAVIWLGVDFMPVDYIGAILIIMTVVIITIFKDK